MGKTVVMVSGGINSTVAAAHAAREGPVHLLFADFGQRTLEPQRQAVSAIAAHLDAPLSAVTFPHVRQIEARCRGEMGEGEQGFSASSSPTSAGPKTWATRAAREGRTGEQSNRRDVRPQGVLDDYPGLLGAMLSAGVQLARGIGARSICCGTSEAAGEIEGRSSAGAAGVDRRREFFYLFDLLLETMGRGRERIALKTPLIDLSREAIVRLGERFAAPLQLTFSCTVGSTAACGKCGDCQARTRAFEAAGVADPAAAAGSPSLAERRVGSR